MRCIFDTNILISALLFSNSVPGRALKLALTRSAVILISAETVEELAEVISRRKFDKYLTSEERAEFLASFVNRATPVEVSENLKVCRDPKDDKFLNLARSGNASYIITGDDDLLVLQTHFDTVIIDARSFLIVLDGNG